MSMIKKLIALTLALAMVLSVSAFAGYSADTYADADKISADCESAVELMYALDIMTGNEKGEFMPEKAVTRAEMAKIVYVILNYGDDDKAETYKGGKFFTDVEAGAWYEGYVNYCAATKLIAGRGDGTFDPHAAVTTAEAAKMMLTAIGYNAEARGYVGDKWSDNTLSDAAIIGLLKGYKANVNTAAPRQWIAVMLENVLLDALTYINMAPSFTGLLTSGENTNITTMGAKYYNLAKVEGVAFATEDTYIDGDDVADDGVLFYLGEDEDEDPIYIELTGTGLKAADLGQNYSLIFDFDSMEAYSVRTLSETAESLIKEMDVDVKYATSGNKANNKYQFTIGDMVAYFEASEINVLWTGGEETTAAERLSSIDVEEMRELIEEGILTPDVWKAIDTDVDGKIDYIIVTEYAYAVINEISTSNKYGDYLNVTYLAEAGETEEEVTFADEDNLYVKDCIITADELEEEQIIKMSYSIDSGKYVVEVLPQVKGVEYKEWDDKNAIFTLGSKEYQVATTWSGYDCDEDVLAVLEDEDNLGEEYNVIYDGDLIVYLSQDDDSYDNMDAVNAQLVLVIDADEQYSNNTIKEKPAITYMDINGDVFTKAYQDGSGVAFEDVLDLIDIDQNEDVENAKYDNDEYDYENGDYAIEGRLFILKSGTKGRVYLVELSEEVDDEGNAEVNEQLSVKTSVLNGFEETEDHLDATGKAITYGDYKVDAANKYFVGAFDSHGDAVYKIMTLDELKNCEDEAAYGQILTLTNAKGTRTTVVGGYIFMDLTSDTDGGYLYIEKIGNVTTDGRKCKVIFDDGSEKTITIANDEDLVENVLYAYSYNFMDDDYTVKLVTLPDPQADEIVELDSDDILWVSVDEAPATKKATLDEEVIAVLTVEIDRDQTQKDDQDEDDMPEFKAEIIKIEFVALKDLETAMIENDVEYDKQTYTQYTDYVFEAEDLFYVVNYRIQETAQELDDNLPDELPEFFYELTGVEYEAEEV